MAATASFSPSSAYWQSTSPTRLLAASQRLALAKLLHPRLPNGEALSADVDIFALLGEDFVRFREQEAYDAARDDPEVDACLLKTLDEKVEQRELWAVDILEQNAAEGEARAWRVAAAGRSAASPESEPCRLWADRGNATAARLLRLVRAALPTVGDQAPYTLLPFANLPCGSTDPRTLVWDFRSDGLHGVIEGASDVELFAREVVYRAGLQRPAEPYLPGNYGHPSHSTWRGGRHEMPGTAADTTRWTKAVAKELATTGVAVCWDFLGADAAQALRVADLGGADDAMRYGDGRPGAGRGDNTCLPDVLPETLLTSLDTMVSRLRSEGCESGRCLNTACARWNSADDVPDSVSPHGLGQCCADRLRLCRFRSWPMDATYSGSGSRYTWHADNPVHQQGSTKKGNGRVLTCIYYLNQDWSEEDGGALRLLRPPGPPMIGRPRSDAAQPPQTPSEIIAEIVPKLDTLVMFWSDLIPHEVLPPKGNKSRRAISVWYLCPTLGSEQFVDGSPLPTDGLTASEAAAEVLKVELEAEAPRLLDELGRGKWDGKWGSRIAEETLAWLEAHQVRGMTNDRVF